MTIVSKVQPKIQPKKVTDAALAAYFSGGGSAALLGWTAIVADSADFSILLQDTGSGTPAITRGSAVSALMDSGYFYEYAANLPAYEGRVVENLMSHSNDFEDVVWSNSNIILTTGQTDPDGGSTATRFRANATNAMLWRDVLTGDHTADYYINSVWLRRVSGTGTIQIQNPTTSGIDITSQLTSSWQRFSVSSTGAGSKTRFAIRVLTLNDEIDVAWGMHELSTNNVLDNSTPSEYIPTTTVAVTKTMSTTNGNTVATNVVTEGTGTELTTWGMRIAPEHTNNLLQSNNFNTTWYKSNATIGANTNIFGTGNSNTKITATASARCIVRQSLAQQVSKNVWRVFFEKEAAQQDRIPIIFMLDPAFTDGWYFGVNPYTGDIEVETASGTPSNDWAGGAYRVKMNDAGEHWEFLFESSPLSTGGFYIWIEPGYLNYPALTTTGGATAGDWVIASEVEEFFNTTIEQVEGSPPIITTTGPLGTDPQQSEWAAANFDGTSDFAISMELEGNVGDGTELLIHSDTTDGSTTFTDSSSNNAVITPVGNAKHSVTQKQFGATGIYLDGSGDYLDVAKVSGHALGSGDYTVEYWMYPTEVYTTNTKTVTPISCWSEVGADEAWLFSIIPGDYLRFIGANFGAQHTYIAGSTTPILVNTMYHVVATRRGSIARLYINGVLEAEDTSAAGNITATTNNLMVGGWWNSAGTAPVENATQQCFAGYLDEIRIVKGFSKYWGQTFTPPDAPFADPEPLVPNPILATEDTDTVLLVHSDTFDGDTDIVDSSYVGRTMTPGGGGVHDTAQSVFGASSINLPAGGAGDVPIDNTDGALTHGTGDFQYDFRVRLTTGSQYQTVYNNGYTNAGSLLFRFDNSASPVLKVLSGVTTLLSDSGGLSLNTWYAYRIIRQSGTLKMYRDGVEVGTVANTTNLSASGPVYLGYTSFSLINGWIDEFRCKTSGLDAFGAYTPATEPFDRGTLAQYEFAYIDSAGNLVLEDQGGAKATAPLAAGNNKCGVFKEGGNLGVTVGGTTGTLVASSNNVGGNGKVLVGHGVTSPILMKNLLGYTGGSLQTQMETNTT